MQEVFMKKIENFFLALLSFSIIMFCLSSCSNGSDDSRSAANNISATATSEGIRVVVNVPADCTVADISRATEDTDSSYVSWFTRENSKGTVTAIDYFVDKDTTYYYKVKFYNSNWEQKSKSESVKITSTVTGKMPPSLTNSPTITYNTSDKTFNFSIKPEFANITSSIAGFQNVTYELAYKCNVDYAWEVICKFEPDATTTQAIYNWIVSKHTGHNFTFTGFIIKFKNENGNEWYQFRIGRDCNAQLFLLENQSTVSVSGKTYKCIAEYRTFNDQSENYSTFDYQSAEKNGNVINALRKKNGAVVNTYVITKISNNNYSLKIDGADAVPVTGPFEGENVPENAKTINHIWFEQSDIQFKADGTITTNEGTQTWKVNDDGSVSIYAGTVQVVKLTSSDNYETIENVSTMVERTNNGQTEKVAGSQRQVWKKQ